DEGISHRYAAKCAELEATFLQLASAHGSEHGAAGSDGPWTPLATVREPYPITVQGHASKPFCFRITFFAPTMPGTAFDLLADILRRPEWDELTESTQIIEKLGQSDAIHYVKAKAIWPTAARDSVLISHITALDLPDASGKTARAYLNVSQSTVDERVPEKDALGIVRMEAGIAGQLITHASNDDRVRHGLEGEQWCRVVQIADGDLKGWIPKSVIKFIATQALPRSLTKVCKQLSQLPPRPHSQLVRRTSEKPRKSAETTISAMSAMPATAASTAISTAISTSTATATSTSTPPAPAAAVANRPQHRELRRVMSASRRGRWLAWLKVVMRYAAPSIIAAVTS
ncbi:hypothetical protein LPJ56_005749, partial [Coemansia sp. RSA 2599]